MKASPHGFSVPKNRMEHAWKKSVAPIRILARKIVPRNLSIRYVFCFVWYVPVQCQCTIFLVARCSKAVGGSQNSSLSSESPSSNIMALEGSLSIMQPSEPLSVQRHLQFIQSYPVPLAHHTCLAKLTRRMTCHLSGFL